MSKFDDIQRKLSVAMGDSVVAKQMVDELKNDLVSTYADATARDAAIPSPSDGMVTQQTDPPGIVYYDADKNSWFFVPKMELANRAVGRAAKMPEVTPLATFSADESWAAGTNLTLSDDTTYTRIGGTAKRVTVGAGGATASLTLTTFSPSDPMPMPRGHTYHVWVWIDDITAINDVLLQISLNADNSALFSRPLTDYAVGGARNGWNHCIIDVRTSVHEPWGEIHRLRFYIDASAATFITFAEAYVDTPAKAKLMVVADACRKSFYDTVYPQLRSRAIPVEWATTHNIRNGDSHVITESQLIEVAKENNNVVGFHSHGDTGWPDLTTLENVRKDTLRAIKWITSLGLPRPVWRCAFLGNDANGLDAQPDALGDILLAQATYKETDGSFNMPPFHQEDSNIHNRWNIPRSKMHDKTEAQYDAMFEELRDYHTSIVLWTHGYGDVTGGTTANLQEDELEYVLSWLDTGIQEGWLEPTTMPALLAEAGYTFGALNGGWEPERSLPTDAIYASQRNTTVVSRPLVLPERSADPSEPGEGESVMWMSDGTGYGDDGDICVASQAGGVVKKSILFDHSAGDAW